MLSASECFPTRRRAPLAACAGALLCGLTLCVSPSVAGTILVDFEDLTVPAAGYYQGADGAGQFTSRGAKFSNTFTDFGSFSVWSGFGYSNRNNTSTPGYVNQYSAYDLLDGAGDASPNYAVGYVSAYDPAPLLTLPARTRALSFRLTNSTYAALAMLQGDSFSKKFGGPTGSEPDYLRLIVTGYDAQDLSLGELAVYLADYRPASAAADYVLSRWTDVNLAPLAAARSFRFSMESSDVDPVFGINTPTYFALDNLLLEEVPEPATLPPALLATGLLALYSMRRRFLSGRPRDART